MSPARPVATATRPTSQRWVPYAALSLLACMAAGFTVAVAISGSAAFDGLVERLYLFSIVVSVSFGALSFIVWRHDPRNRIATIAMVVAWAYAASTLLERYVMLGADRGWPGLTWTLWISQWLWLPALLAIPTVLALRFPDGRLPSGRWRPLEIAALSGLVVLTAGFATTPYGILAIAPPLALDHPAILESSLAVYYPGLVLTVGAILGCVAGFASRMVRARGRERTQLLWGLAGMVGSAGLVALSVVLGPGGTWLSLVGVTILPAAIAVAILRHGLFDVALALNRSLVYGVVTVAIVAVYVVTVGLLGDVLGRRFGAPLLATGIVAVSIEPLRRRVQHLANRLVYGDRDDPYTVLARLGERLTAAADRDLLGRATDAVVRAMRLRGAAILVDGEVRAASGDVEEPHVDLPLRVPAGVVGTLRVAPRPGHELTDHDRRLITDLGRQVSVAIHAATLQREVEASRARLIMAREEERRRIRRDLHDGLGPTLAAIGLDVERAGLEMEEGSEQAAARLVTVTERLREAVRDVRALVDGLRPASLDELGLDGAVKELVRGLEGGPVRLAVETAGPLDDLPAAVSLAAYRITGEAVTNALRHAEASSCLIRLAAGPANLRVLVRDDGMGIRGAPGIGLQSMAARANELGGTLVVEDEPGGGTRVVADLPLATP